MKIKYYEAKDNPMFPPEITMLIRFVRPEKAAKCAVCGKKRKRLWTMLVPFRGQIFGQFAMTPGDELEALAPICDDHPMVPIFIELAEKIANQPLDSDAQERRSAQSLGVGAKYGYRR